MGIHTMGSQGNGGSNGKQLQCQQLTRQSSMYSLTLDEVQNQLADLGKPLNSMNLDEFLKSVWSLEGNQTFGTDTEGTAVTNQTSLQRQASLSLSSALSKKTVDEVWKDIQQSKIDGEKKSRERQPTLGEMTLEDFLIEAGVVTEASTDENVGAPIAEVDPSVAPQFAQHSQWMQYPQPPQYHHPQQSIMGIYMPAQPMPQPLALVTPGVMDVPYPENQVSLPSPLMGTLSDTQTSGRKRGSPEDIVEKTVERRQKRMIRNRESAARSRARKQAYTNELENKVSRLEEENERLRKQKFCTASGFMISLKLRGFDRLALILHFTKPCRFSDNVRRYCPFQNRQLYDSYPLTCSAKLAVNVHGLRMTYHHFVHLCFCMNFIFIIGF